jgi:excisionase family DNA binding protein
VSTQSADSTASFTLQEAADELGVHYMTAYRYVRLGQLDAVKVGGVWQVADRAMSDFREGSGAGPVARGESAPWAARLEDRLVEGDAQGAWGVIEAAMAAGADVRSVYLDLLSPSMVNIGTRWAAGQLDVAVEHQATGIALRIVGRLGSRCVRRGRSRGTVVLGAPAGESHGLVTAMLGDLMRLHGWDVTDLGANTPTASFLHAVQRTSELKAVGLSVTHATDLGEVEACCRTIKDAKPDVLVVVGGGGLGDVDVEDLGADVFASSADQLHELILGR